MAFGVVLPAVEITSLGFADTSFVLAEDDTVIIDVNDCKPRGRALTQIAKAFPPTPTSPITATP